MKLKQILPLLVFFAITSCGSSKVIYAKYGRMKLTPGESNSYPVNGNDVSMFSKCCSVESDVIFLNRALHQPEAGYDIFISVSESLHQSEFSQLQSSDPSITVINSKTALVSKIKVDGYLLKKNDQYVSRFVYHEIKSGLLVIIDVASSNDAIAHERYENMVNYLDEKIRL